MRRFALHLIAVVLATGVLASGSAAGAAYENATISLYHTEADLDDAEEVQAAITNGTAVEAGTTAPAERVVLGDHLVVVIESGQLARRVDARDGTPTDGFFAVLDRDPQLHVHQLNYRQLYGPKVLPVGPQNTTVYRAGNTTYAVVETGSVDVDRPQSDGRNRERIEGGDEFVVEIATNASTAPSEGPQFEVVRNESTFVDGQYAPLPPAETRVAVRTYVEADDDEHLLSVDIDDGREITAPVDASVDEYSDESTVRIDLRDVEAGTGYTLELVHDGSVVDSVTGTVQEPNATLSDVRITEADGERRLNLTATLSHGGQVVTATADGERRATRRIQPGNETELSIPVVRGDTVLVPEDGYIRVLRPDGTVYPDGVYELGAQGAPLRTPTASRTPTPTPDGEQDPNPTQGTTGAGTEDQPGFGAAVAALALSVAVLAGRRSRD